ncbi:MULTISPECIES: enterotoxin EntFM [Bacillus]|uniref:Peptidoglycan endopeptidase n=3 Tax=Bacillus thuringiensis TaxID=1428 RepID=A0ABD6SZR9_BACTU|nr:MULTISPECIES: enterotoxin EntFM [Bacillus]EEM42215.1 Enterotoxin [Bacillus thuringiensis serovar sotto str. T04001]AFQ15498.1 enterotoxin [Bacillus thuringiensis HD-771]AJQ58634.1 peptidase P60 [Bacillus thuringiensis serovar morrisoni]AMR84328.1 peptidase P60 [Bacillus thuringiensis]EOO07134.1 enterotoxin [Bacillus cereus str. Schrouff]
MKKVIAGLAAASVAGVAVPGMDSAHAQVSNEALKEINGQTQTQTQTTVTETKTVETTSELKYTVTADVLNVRSGAGTGHNVISKVKSGQVLQVVGQENGWFKVNVNGQTGYVSGDFVTTGGKTGTTVQQGTGTYTVNVSSLNVRTGPSTSHTVLGSVNKGKTVQVVGEVQDWFKINFNGGTGYVSKDFVTKGGSAVSNETQQPTTNNNTTTVQTGGSYVVNTGALKVRTGPATYNAVIGGVTNGKVLNVTGAENGWYKINHNGRTGYVSADFVKFVKGGVNNVTNNNNNNVTNNVQQPGKDVQKPTTSGDTSSIAGFARSLNGSPYRTAGTTPAGFDCSGFIHYVLNQTGHKGARQTVAGYWSSKTKTSNPQPGDLVYFQNTYKSGPSHMGVYLGNGQFISAETDATGVRISSVSNSYWSKHILGYTKAY